MLNIAVTSETEIEVSFPSSNKKVRLKFSPGTDCADITGLREDCPVIKLDTNDNHIHLNTPNYSDFL